MPMMCVEHFHTHRQGNAIYACIYIIVTRLHNKCYFSSTLDKICDWTNTCSITDTDRLEHPAGNIIVIKRKKEGKLKTQGKKEDSFVMSQYKDTRFLSEDMRFRAGMLRDHMPWKYDALFAGQGEEGPWKLLPG